MRITRRKSAVLRSGLLLTCGSLWLAACGGQEPAPTATGSEPAAPTSESAAAAPGPTGSAAISGTVAYQGEVPSLKPLSMSADPACAAKHSAPVPSSALVLGADQALGNVLIYVKSGLPQGQWPAPAEPAVIDQRGCIYEPHVIGVVKGQPVKFLNSDGILHNVHALPEKNQEFNIAMPAARTEAPATFDQPEAPFRVKCDVHPWMNAYVAVFEHPYFDTTGPDGQFSLANLPAGTYEVEAWHERLGTQTQTVTVADGAAATVSFTFQRPSSAAE